MEGRVVWCDLSSVMVVCPFCKVPELRSVKEFEQPALSICKKGSYTLGAYVPGIYRWVPGVDYTGKKDPPLFDPINNVMDGDWF